MTAEMAHHENVDDTMAAGAEANDLRPPENSSRVAKCWASAAGVRE
jgi:hypothetical protein